MTIEKLSETKVLISLCGEDMDNFRLNISKMGFGDERSRRVLLRLLELARRETGADLKLKAALIEALPLQSGCLLLVTFTNKERRKTYKVKSIDKRLCYVFGNAEKMLSAAEDLYRTKTEVQDNRLWLSFERYYIVFDNPFIRFATRDILKKYAQEKFLSSVSVSRIKENGKMLCCGNALSAVGKVMFNAYKTDTV